MLKFLDKIWSHSVWVIVKWPFGFLILWFVLSQIWFVNTIPDYDHKIIPKVEFPALKFPEVKLFDNSRMLKGL